MVTDFGQNGGLWEARSPALASTARRLPRLGLLWRAWALRVQAVFAELRCCQRANTRYPLKADAAAAATAAAQASGFRLKSKQGTKAPPDELSRLKHELAQSRKRERDQISINEKLVGSPSRSSRSSRIAKRRIAMSLLIASMLAHAKLADTKFLELESHKAIYCFKTLQLQDMVLSEYIDTESASYNKAIADAYIQCDLACDAKATALNATLKEQKAKLEEQYKQWEAVFK